VLTNVTDGQTDRQTDRRTSSDGMTATLLKHVAVKITSAEAVWTATLTFDREYLRNGWRHKMLENQVSNHGRSPSHVKRRKLGEL